MVSDTPGTPNAPALTPLGRWRIGALVFCGAVVLLGVGTPLGVMLHWLFTRITARQVEYSALTFTLNTLGLSGAVTLLSVIIALPLAALVRSSSSGINRVLTRLPLVPFALPGIVVGLATVFFTTQFLPVLYQTLPILIIAYLLRFLPISITATATAFREVNWRLVETAESLGATGWQVLVRLRLPLSRTGVLSGGALVFLAVMKELPIGLMLAPTGFHTLSYRIWSAYQEAIFSQIGLPGLILMVVSLLSIDLILRADPGRIRRELFFFFFFFHSSQIDRDVP